MLRTSALLVLVSLSVGQAATIAIDFEGLNSLDPVTSQFAGLTFQNATVLTAGISLNEMDFPPQSGVNVVFDDAGPITILFHTPTLFFSGYFTYVVPLTIEAFDSADLSVGFAASLFSANDGFTGEPGSSPNEFIQVAFAGGVSRVVITGDAFGGSFVMDDVSYTSAIPEPATVFLFGVAFSALVCQIRRHLTKHYKYSHKSNA